MAMSQTTNPRGRINYDNISRLIERRVRAAEDAGYTKKPDHEEVLCPCGYSGPPEVIVQHSEWEASDCEFDIMVCPKCGDA